MEFSTPNCGSMALGFPEELLPVFVPVAVFWIASSIHELFAAKDDFRLFTEEEQEACNLVSRKTALANVLLNQALQIALATVTFAAKGEDRGDGVGAAATSWLRQAKQVAVAMVVMDTMAYFWHRLTHQSQFLMKHVHSMHHRLVATYAYGAQYVHPVDFLFSDLCPSVAATLISGMSPRTAAVFFSVVTIKTVDDHCGHWFLGCVPVSRFFTYKTGFHMAHHQRWGFKYNYSIFFSCFWDVVLGTYLPYAVEEREGGGGYQIKRLKDD